MRSGSFSSTKQAGHQRLIAEALYHPRNRPVRKPDFLRIEPCRFSPRRISVLKLIADRLHLQLRCILFVKVHDLPANEGGLRPDIPYLLNGYGEIVLVQDDKISELAGLD